LFRNCLKRKISEECSQAQYLVVWAPTLEAAWAVQAYKDLGYTVVNVSPITMAAMIDEPANQHLFEQIACDVCNCKHDTVMIRCDKCDRGYQKGCLPHDVIPEEQEDLPTRWHCEYCNWSSVTTANRIITERSTRGRRPGDTNINLLKLGWAPTWEPESNIPEDLTTAWKAEMQQQQPTSCKRMQTAQTSKSKEGMDGRNMHIEHMLDTARHN
jgi:hypothetical protein